MKKDVSVELARLLACFIVIGVHTKLSVIGDCVNDFSRLYLCSILADGVAVFWMITGFFLFRNVSYTKVLKHTWKRVGMPLLIFSIAYFYLRDWLVEGTTLSASLFHTGAEYLRVGGKLLAWSNPVPGTSHLWYLYVYILLMLAFPILKSFVQYLDQNPLRMKWFLGGTFLALVLNDVASNRLLEFSHHSVHGVIPAAVQVIWGYIFYRYRHKFEKSRYIWMSLVGFFGLNLIRTGMQNWKFGWAQPDNYWLYWHSAFGLLCAVLILIFCFSFVHRWKGCGRWICVLSSYTFPVYLIHMTVRDLLRRFFLPEMLYEKIAAVFGGFVGEILYTICIVFCIFLLSFLLAALWRCVQKKKTAIKNPV